MEALASCERCESPLERDDLRCAICGRATPSRDEGVPAPTIQVLRCSHCAATVSYDPRVQGLRCGFCDSVVRLESIEDPVEQADAFLPFRVSVEEARQALSRWLSGLGFFRPGDLLDRARLESLRPLWWAGWVFDAQVLTSWTADSDEGSRRSRWAPHSGQVEMKFDYVVVSASRGLRDEEVSRLLSGYDLSSATPAPQGPDEATVERFEVQRSFARWRIVQQLESLAAREVEAKHVPGTSFRNVRVALRLRALVTRRLGFPVYVMAYRYRDELYRAVVGGQERKHVFGDAPYSVAKITLVVLAGLGVLALLGLVLTRV